MTRRDRRRLIKEEYERLRVDHPDMPQKEVARRARQAAASRVDSPDEEPWRRPSDRERRQGPPQWPLAVLATSGCPVLTVLIALTFVAALYVPGLVQEAHSGGSTTTTIPYLDVGVVLLLVGWGGVLIGIIATGATRDSTKVRIGASLASIAWVALTVLVATRFS